jgi:predicted outer membrane repeat protein
VLQFVRIVSLLGIALVCPVCTGAVVYVDPDAPGPVHNGTSWDNAFLTIQKGVDAAKPDGEVWVANGTYAENVVIGAGVRVYGGFLGAEPGGYESTLDQRDVEGHRTIIDGNRSGSCVKMANRARVDGCTVTNGSGTLAVDAGYTRGGGFFCRNLTEAATIANCTVEANQAGYGGGIYCYGSTVVIENSVIEGNSSTRRGGGIYLQLGSYDVQHNEIRDNYAADFGGGARYSTDAEGPFCWNLVEYNRSQTYGGGLSVDGCAPVIANNVVRANAAGNGGGIWAKNIRSVFISDNEFTENRSEEGSAGGIFISGDTGYAPRVTGNLIADNWSIRNGGGLMVASGASTLVSGNTIVRNVAVKKGGGMYLHVGAYGEIRDNLCAENSAYYGGGIEMLTYQGVLVGNEIRDNDAVVGGGIRMEDVWTASFTANCIERNTATLGGGVFIGPSCQPSFTGNVIRDNEAVYGGGVSVTEDARASFTGDEISANAATVGAGLSIEDAEATIRSCSIASNQAGHRGGGINADDGPLTVDDASFTGNSAEYGGAIATWGSSCRMTGCLLWGNEASYLGGGFYADTGMLRITANRFEDNRAGAMGGALFGWEADGSGEIAGNQVIGNLSPRGGGLCFAQISTPIVARNYIAYNLADYGGGVCYDLGNDGSATDNVIVYNTATQMGGGVVVRGASDMVLIGNTIANNASPTGAGLACEFGDIAVFLNIVAGNEGIGIYQADGTADLGYNDIWGNVPYDCVGLVPDATDMSEDPMFVDAPNGDFHIRPASPCVDAGDNGLVAGQLDVDGDARILDGDLDAAAIVDIGADEVLVEEAVCPGDRIDAGWNWFSIPIEPLDPNAHAVLERPGENYVTANLFRWDAVAKSFELVDSDFTDLEVGRGYLLWSRDHHQPSYWGVRRRGDAYIAVPARGWVWIGHPQAAPTPLASLCVRHDADGQVRTPSEDVASADPWVSWNWIFWDSASDNAGLCGLAGADDDTLRPWFGYWVWTHTEDLTLIVP